MDWNNNPERNEDDNKKAEDFQRTQRVKERKYMLISIILLIIGIVFDVLVLNGFRKFGIVEFDNISLAIVQAQAGISTLTIAILALMGNQTNESYLGVRLNDFLLNKKPIWFTQKRIIGISLMAIFFNFIFHMAGLYNLVVMIFLVACLIVWISVDEVYEAFSGVEKIEEEIKTYVLEQIKKGDTQSRIKVLDDFCKEWKKKITLQGNGEYEEYTKIYEQIFVANFAEDKSRKILVDRCRELAELLLNDISTAMRGILFVEKSYENAWVYIQNPDVKVQAFQTPFWLFQMVFYHVEKAMKKLSVQEVEEVFDWDWFTKVIIRVNLYVNYKEEVQSTSELKVVEQFSSFLGRYVSNKKEIDFFLWYRPLISFENYGIYSSDLRNLDTKIIAKRNFHFMAAQIKFDDQNSIIGYLYNQGLSQSYYILETEYAIMILKIHCYIYYLAYNETTKCIEQEQIERCRNMIENETVKQGFQNFLSQIIYKDKNIFKMSGGSLDIFNNTLENTIYNSLKGYEESPKNGNGKWLMMENVVSDFVIFLTSYIAENEHIPQLLNQMITDTKVSAYHARYVQGDYLQELKRFYEMIEEDPKKILERAKEAYSMLEGKICEVYKNHIIHNPIINAEKDINKEKEELKCKISKYLTEKFDGLLDQKTKEFQKVSLLCVNTFKDVNLSNIIKGNYEWLFLRLITIFFEELRKKGQIRLVRKTQFKTDEEYLEYLRSKQQCIIIGSAFQLNTSDFRRWKEVKGIIESTEHYTVSPKGPVLILEKNSFSFNIGKIYVEIIGETIEESGAEFDPEDEMYNYEPSLGVKLKFTRKELEEYLNNTRSVVNISLDIAFKEKDGIIGEVIMDK